MLDQARGTPATPPSSSVARSINLPGVGLGGHSLSLAGVEAGVGQPLIQIAQERMEA
jgi:hypothetical protein